MPASSRQDRPHHGSWAITNTGNIFYRTDNRQSRHGTAALSSSPPARFPAPLIGPRRSRPHAIHIITYPPGYVPRELRPRPKKSKTQSLNHRAAKLRRSIIAAATATTATAASPTASTGAAANSSSNASAPTAAATAARDQSSSHVASALRRPSLGKLLSSFSLKRTTTGLSATAAVTPPLCTPLETPRSQSVAAPTTATATATAATPAAGIAPPAYDVRPDPATGVSNQSHHPQTQIIPRSHHQPHQPSVDSTLSASTAASRATTTSNPADATMAAATARGGPVRPSPYQLASNRNSIMSVRSAKSAVSSLVTEVPKPVASGSGVSCSILLAEPNIFLSGFDHHDSHAQRELQTGTALLRGKLQINVTKNVKIKAVQLKLIGRARTEWPEGIPPLKQEIFEEESLRTQVLTFFNAMNGGWETEYGNQCTYQLKSGSANSSTVNLAAPPRPVSLLPSSSSQRSGLTAKELKRLSLQSVQSRSFGKGDNGVASPTQAKGFKVFYPGTYDYSFELPIDHHQLETTKLQYGSVRWELHATVDRAGAFKPNLHGMKEVSIVRLPDSMSLETTEPISISRQWEDQLHYDIIISGKSFPIGSKIPIAFKLTPLAKVQVHKIKVFVTESIEYWTNDRRVTRKDPGRKILLLEKVAGKPLDSSWASSDVTTIRGGELSASERREARDMAHRRRLSEAARTHRHPQPLPEPTANLLGDLDLGLESMWGSTEIEANVQIPTCEMMAKNKDLRLHPDCSWKNVNVYHWIKVRTHRPPSICWLTRGRLTRCRLSCESADWILKTPRAPNDDTLRLASTLHSRCSTAVPRRPTRTCRHTLVRPATHHRSSRRVAARTLRRLPRTSRPIRRRARSLQGLIRQTTCCLHPRRRRTCLAQATQAQRARRHMGSARRWSLVPSTSCGIRASILRPLRTTSRHQPLWCRRPPRRRRRSTTWWWERPAWMGWRIISRDWPTTGTTTTTRVPTRTSRRRGYWSVRGASTCRTLGRRAGACPAEAWKFGARRLTST